MENWQIKWILLDFVSFTDQFNLPLFMRWIELMHWQKRPQMLRQMDNPIKM